MLGAWGKTGRKRTRLGKWLDKKKITQIQFSKEANIHRHTMSNLCNDDDFMPQQKTRDKVIKHAKKIDPKVREKDLWG
ncbi:transcriptional regulator [Chengkuizengella axinellae]|uniref:Transcriptional regulator n=1 Tax=Chengkuizengella axinellae TaxID=3064388 RepID=A0ABT9J5T4_9BACL|nr:transcriptional regulator [Chengkuizengella sp. 2205SS18-9]MDP5276314.1 transcriptional regulator [Chengkuizengella sp. 2205SS18-9]